MPGRKFYGYVQRRKDGKIEVPNIRKRNDDALWLRMLKKEKYIMVWYEIGAYEIPTKTKFYFK